VHSLPLRILLMLCLQVAVSRPASAGPAEQSPLKAPASDAQVIESYGKLPLRFEANHGQADRSVRFLSRGAGYDLYLAGQDAVLALHRPGLLAGKSKLKDASVTDIVRMQLTGANPQTKPVGMDLLPGVSNYLTGTDPAQWHIGVPAWSRVRYAGIYPGIDLIYYGNHKQLEYDFVVAPGATVEPIRLHFEGARGLSLDGAGNLVVGIGDETISFKQPVVYQLLHGVRQPVVGNFKLLAKNSVGFELGNYDRSQPLTIDPTLLYATYLGGSIQDVISAIAVDSAGAVYLTGTTGSTDYPVTPGTVQTTPGTVFVTKMNQSGTALIYSTFLGADGSGAGIAVDSLGEAYVTGWTNTGSFPVTKGAFQATKQSPSPSYTTGFFSKLNAAGTGLIYSTYLGGSSADEATGLAVDSSGNAYVTGYANSSNFPTTPGVVQSTNKSAAIYGWNEFVTKLNPAASGAASLVYSTYLGGSNEYSGPNAMRVAVDKSMNAYVTGIALSTDFPVTPGVFQPINHAASQRSDMTLAKLNSTATKLVYSTYLGGSSSVYGDDSANGLVVDSAGNAYLVGSTHETDFPVTKGAYQTTSGSVATGGSAGFVTKMNPMGTALVYSTYLGGSGGEHGDAADGVAIDSSGDAYITGSAGSTDFPVTSNALQTQNPASFNYGSVAFLTELNPAGNGLVYSTYMGGGNSFDDTGYGVALGQGGAVYLAGFTGASDFPITKDAYETTFNSQYFTMGFVAELALGAPPSTQPTAAAITPNADPAVTGTNMIFTAAVVPVNGTGVPTGNVVFSIDEANVATVPLSNTGSATYAAGPMAFGQHYVLASYTGSATYGPSGGGVTETITPALPVIAPAAGTYQSAQLVTITDATPGTSLYYTTDGSTPKTSSTQYTAPILLSTSETVRAIAAAPAIPNSSPVSATYTLINAPSALAVAATTISSSSATLNGLVKTLGMAGSFYFQYGLSSTSLASSTPATNLAGSALGSRLSFVPVPVSAQATNLKAGTTYYYQVVVTTAAGTCSGAVLSFTTN
jgi:hypothetical protein